MAGPVRFCVHIAGHGGAGVGEDAGDGLVGRVADPFVFIDDDLGEQGPVQHAAFSGLGLGVEIPEIGEDVGDLIEPGARVRVGVGEAVEPVGDLVEAGADAVLFALEEVEGNRVGVVGLDELEPLGFELVPLRFEEFAFVVAGGFELVEHLVQHGPDTASFLGGEGVGAVGGFDLLLDAVGEDRGAGAGGALAAPASAGEVLVPVALLVAGGA